MNQESVAHPVETKIHDMRHMDMGDAYDMTQYSMTFAHGDVLLVKDGIAILYLAWPTMVFGSSKVFHGHELTYEFVEQDLRGRGMLPQLQSFQDGLLLAWAVACG